MQFTKAEEYGLFGALHLAQTEKGQVVALSEISEAQDVPEKFLAKIFQSLSKGGIIRSHRGVRGGFSLAKDPHDITIREVLETIQGPYHLMRCTEDMSLCRKSCEFCSVREVVLMAENRLTSVFGAFTLADLVEWQKTRIAPAKAISLV